MKPYIHSVECAKRFGGKWEDYMDINEFMDSSKGVLPGQLHRLFYHTSFACQPDGCLERIFGKTRVNSDGKIYSTRDVFELHILSDYGYKFIPTPQDFLANIEIEPWMENGNGYPPSAKGVEKTRRRKVMEKTKSVVD
jgi:hypothetical protein